MPRGFEFMEPGTDVWAPLVFDPTSPQHRATFNRAVARLAPGVTPERASQELQALIPAMHRDLAKTGQWGRRIRVRVAAGLGRERRPADAPDPARRGRA